MPLNIAEGAGKTTSADKARYYAVARGSAMESASHLDVMRVEELIDEERYGSGLRLLERIVGMLTRMTPELITSTVAFKCTCTTTIRVASTITSTATCRGRAGSRSGCSILRPEPRHSQV
jgi:hypothetical protein